MITSAETISKSSLCAILVGMNLGGYYSKQCIQLYFLFSSKTTVYLLAFFFFRQAKGIAYSQSSKP